MHTLRNPAGPPAVSVVVPMRNARETISEALQSLIDQTDGDFEVVVVDDGSTDDSAAIVMRYASQYPRIRLFEQPYGGIVAALNNGIGMSRGEIIARLDADDIALPDRLLRQRRCLELQEDVDVVSCLVDIRGADMENEGYRHYVDWLNSVITREEIALNRFVESPVAHPSVMFRRHCWERWGGYRIGDFPEDYELWLRWMEQGAVFLKVPETLLVWRDHPDRLSRKEGRYRQEAFYKVKTPYLARWLSHNLEGRHIVVWGAGRETRKRAELLTAHGLEIVAYIDVDPLKVGQRIQERPVLDYATLGRDPSRFILVYAGARGSRQRIGKHLADRGMAAGRDYLFCA